MPIADGRAVLNGARARWPAIPVLLLSAMIETTPPIGPVFSGVLTKPVSLAALRRALAGLLGIDIRQPGGAGSAVPMSYPGPEVLAEAQALIRLGAMSDLVDWADRLLSQHPDWRTFARFARELAERGDLDSLSALCRNTGRS